MYLTPTLMQLYWLYRGNGVGNCVIVFLTDERTISNLLAVSIVRLFSRNLLFWVNPMSLTSNFFIQINKSDSLNFFFL